MGLNQVKDLTRRTQARILRERPFLRFSLKTISWPALTLGSRRPTISSASVRWKGLARSPGLLNEVEGQRGIPGSSLFRVAGGVWG